MHPVFLLLSAVSAFLAVTMGAFGAHALKAVLAPDMLAVYKTAVTYQMWHALGLGIIALLRQQNPDQHIVVYAGWLMFAGIILFSGSLYVLSLSGIKWLGMITPIGGLCFLSAWLLVSLFAYRAYKSGNT
ncbi:hypothetical protein BJAS_P2785 [Bathymodiolus japonicus methanotrophic gill symbiont]|uniref:DUF423 domain-containing protein n=1 Tax=Bathymodiolus japonicus methanotrophic gill symbiont TaxID=113269 RepID=UPI001B3E738E|nr:DUF423 domain-containing protein [Bathymodiolus japonicus methanotrophic gill symbiont]GFO72494.1 hypothetical protein BJAS_P2785 [Bathymodiolus japonicus methanotrophic gill symbiont]